MTFSMHYARALSDLRVWMCHLCSIVGGVGDAETPERDPNSGRALPPLEPVRAVGKPYRLG
jgi:hypothetical protein